MRVRLVTLLLGAALSSPVVLAEEKQAEPHDYSRATLLYIFNQKFEDENAPKTEPDVTFEYSTTNWNIRWLPFLTPIVPNRNSGTASIMPVVDPFALLGMAFPETADTYPDRGPQTRYRKKMLSVVSAANRADKQRRLRGGG